MKLIPLTRGLFAQVDDADYPNVSRFNWQAIPRPDGNWVARRTFKTDGRRDGIQLHAYLTGWVTVDHIDGDALNDQRYNMRPATRAQNNANRRKGTGGTSQFKGVWWHRAAGKWAAGIRADGKVRHLGLFVLEIDAALAYDAAAREAFGEFAALNVPKAGEQSALRTLRQVQPYERAIGYRKRMGSASSYRGVTASPSGKWKARLQVDSERVHLGTFETEIDAARAWDAAARVRFGAARSDYNLPNPGERSALRDEPAA